MINNIINNLETKSKDNIKMKIDKINKKGVGSIDNNNRKVINKTEEGMMINIITSKNKLMIVMIINRENNNINKMKNKRCDKEIEIRKEDNRTLIKIWSNKINNKQDK